MTWLSRILAKNQHHAEIPPSQPITPASAEELQEACEFVELKLQGYMSKGDPEKSYWDRLMQQSRETYNFPLTPHKYVRNAIKTILEESGVDLIKDTSAFDWACMISVQIQHDFKQSFNTPKEPLR